MKHPVIIFTGGTLSSSQDQDGRTRVKEGALTDMAKDLGYHIAPQHPYTIDSILFNMGLGGNVEHTEFSDAHYVNLMASVRKVLDAGDIPVVCGGSDTKAWYSTLLEKDLKRHGYLATGSGQKIVFLSSMKRLEEDKNLVNETLKAGIILAQEKTLTGGFALSAENKAGNSFVIHDVSQQFDKISSKLVDAFRSIHPAGHIKNNRFKASDSYRATKGAPKQSGYYAHIAPPLVYGQDNAAMLTYLQAMQASGEPLDGIIIEGLPDDGPGKSDIIDAVGQLSRSGVRVIFCNPVRFNTHAQAMKPVYKDMEFALSPVAAKLKSAGAELITGLPKDVYIDALFTTPDRMEKTDTTHPLRMVRDVPRAAMLRIRYVPDLGTMKSAIAALAPHASNLSLCALPNATLPNTLLPCIMEFSAQTHFLRTFEYAGEKYKEDGRNITETLTPTTYDVAMDIGEAVLSETNFYRRAAHAASRHRA